MNLTIKDLTKDITQVDIADIASSWQWKLADMVSVVAISCLGDFFLQGQDGAVYWLQTDYGNLTKVANSLSEYQQLLLNEEQADNWFLPQLVEQLRTAGKFLKANEVYSFKVLPALGGEYSVDNFEPTDMSVHFAFTGQICEQIKDQPEGTPINSIKLT
jgi:hypothetical protein